MSLSAHSGTMMQNKFSNSDTFPLISTYFSPVGSPFLSSRYSTSISKGFIIESESGAILIVIPFAISVHGPYSFSMSIITVLTFSTSDRSTIKEVRTVFPNPDAPEINIFAFPSFLLLKKSIIVAVPLSLSIPIYIPF